MRERDLDAREQAVTRRERSLRDLERTTGAHAIEIAMREEIVALRETALRALAEADSARRDRERLVEQLQRANEQLVLATVRADELADRAQAGERAKDEFLAILGHEMRNPLAPILAAVELMELRAPDAVCNERATIKRQVRHMMRLVDDLVDISRITGGKIELHREPVELAAVVAHAVELTAPLVTTKRHALSVRVPDRGLLVDVDPARMTQVVANLLTNAAKYTPEGGRIEVVANRQGEHVALAVRDNGIGISAEMLPRVFEIFAQEQQALDRAHGGLGLGLAIVKSIVERHDGTVVAHSEGHGTGSELVIEIPAHHAGIQAAPCSVVTPIVPTDQRLFKILVVDDGHDAADVTGQLLTILGHDVRVAYDGPSAIATACSFAPDVALLDVGLPGMNGYELAAELRRLVGDTVRLIAVTGYGQAEDRQRSKDAGFEQHLVKPVNLASLRAALR